MDKDLASRQQARVLLRETRLAFQEMRTFSQEKVDRICEAAVQAGLSASRRLAEAAVAETGFGNVEGKVSKNEFACRNVWAAIAPMKTCGLVSSEPEKGLYEYADPFGVVAAIIPVTNPTSTALFKALICLKARCGMVASPHPRSIQCVSSAVEEMHRAAVAAGAPEGILNCMTEVSLAGTEELMKSDDTDLILATGGSGLVRAAYSSGKPAYGVGPGNSPAYVDRSADLRAAARAIVASQTFDNSTICASEQSLVLDRPIKDKFLKAMESEGAYVCNAKESVQLGRICMKGRGMNPDIVGLAPYRIAEMAGFEVSRETTVLLAECSSVGPDAPLSIEKLAPVLAVFTEDGWEDGCRRCIDILNYGGMGHTLAIHCTDDEIVHHFAEKKPVNRILVNSPSSQGAVGLTTNLFPSMTLGCGSFGGNVTSDNIGPQHLLNIKRLAYLREDVSLPAFAPASGVRAPDKGAEREPVFWAPRPSSKAQSPSDVNEAFTSSELQDIIERALATGADGDCPFGKCAECPPTGVNCGSESPDASNY